VEAHFARKKATPPAPRIQNVAEKDGVHRITLDHPGYGGCRDSGP
jgi:hypothetical protein